MVRSLERQASRLFLLLSLICLGSATAPPLLAFFPYAIAHRGGSVSAPENTLATYDVTLSSGVEWVEFDVWNSLDGIPVCHHDPTLDRTTDGTGFVYEKTLAELKQLDAGSWYGPEFIGERIPTLEEALNLVLSHGGRVLLDIKRINDIPTIAQVIDDVGFPHSDIFAWIRIGVGTATYYKNWVPGSGVFLSQNGPTEFHEKEMWERATADNGDPDLGLISPWWAIYQNVDFVELGQSYGLVMVATGVLTPYYQEAFDMNLDGLVIPNPLTIAPLIPLPNPACSDGIDNDGDGLTDSAEDPGCFGPEDRQEYSQCSDGIDNDNDGLTDFGMDPGCFAPFYPFESPACDDGVDNNDDGLVDLDDPGCFERFDQREGLACNDGLDNDEDGLTDFEEDGGCDGPMDTTETGAPAGAVPDGNTTPGTQLTVERANSGDLTLSWGASCDAGDDDYGIYEGELGNFWSHEIAVCGTLGNTFDTITPGPGSRYFIVVPQNGDSEGSYGRRSNNAKRPAAPTTCLQQLESNCD